MVPEVERGSAKTSTTIERTFLDTNVIVYAFDTHEPRKREIALEIINGEGVDFHVVSTQILLELYDCLTRKFRTRVDRADAEAAVRTFAGRHLVQVDLKLIFSAIQRTREHSFSFLDAVHVEAAIRAQCTRVLSEDMQHGRRIGGLVIENPFRGV